MFKHDIPEYLPRSVGIGPLYKVTLRTQPYKATALFAKARTGDDSSAEIADRWFLATLVALYGRQPFKRGNLDAGRLNRLFGREVVPADERSFDPTALDAELRIDVAQASNFFDHMT